jgi:SAM-dependent methyltransferase
MLCDYSEELLALTRRQVAESGVRTPVEFTHCSAEDLPLPDGTYDFIQCMEVLEHLHHPDRALAEFRRVARSGARLVISVPHPPEWFHNEGHIVAGYEKDQICGLVTGAGWRVVRVEYCMLILTRLFLGLRQIIPIPLPLIPIVQLENLLPQSWCRRLLPYDIVVVAERND